MSHRRPLPNRRQCETFDFRHAGRLYTGTVGYYPDSRPGEIFMSGDKVGSHAEANARDAAVGTSIALQFGAPINVLRDAMTRLDGAGAAGAIGALLDKIAELEQRERHG